MNYQIPTCNVLRLHVSVWNEYFPHVILDPITEHVQTNLLTITNISQ